MWGAYYFPRRGFAVLSIYGGSKGLGLDKVNVPRTLKGSFCFDYHKSKNVTGTVWDNITATQENYPQTKVPRSFEVDVNGQKMWVHGNATEHIYDEVKGFYNGGKTAYTNPDLYTQELMNDFYYSLKQAAASGIKYGEKIVQGNWEFIFAEPRIEGLFPVVKHS